MTDTASIVARWQDWEGQGLEHCTCRRDGQGLTLEGAVIGPQDALCAAMYSVRTDAAFRTREVRVRYIDGDVLHVVADGVGTWRDVIDDVPLPNLAGCIDVDLGLTPATNTLPITRLDLNSGQSVGIRAAYVRALDEIGGRLTIQPADQRYTCLEPGRRYRYDGVASGFSAELEFDAFGLVLDYPGVFRRVALPDQP